MSASSRIVSLSTEELAAPTPLYVTFAAAEKMFASIGSRPAESGGALGGTRRSSVVEHLHLDESASMTSVTYYPDITAVNETLRRDWNPRGINLMGFAHSHPRGATRPSANDLEYSERILRAIPAMGRMLLPIVQSAGDGGPAQIIPWAVERRGAAMVLTEPRLHIADPARLPDVEASRVFARVRDAYHLPTLAAARVVVGGAGGSAAWLIDLARTGVCEFVLIDPDVVEEPNLATQHVSLDDLGEPKVSALARRITAVNPFAHVVTVQADVMDIDDEAFARLLKSPFPSAGTRVPARTLLCAFTDDFPAQARIARLGLQFDLPTITATIYERGLGVELAFAASGVTRACIRCALSSRYRQQVLEGQDAVVASNGSPLWATARLNALKTPIALALLHATAAPAARTHPGTQRWLRALEAITDRNLVLTSLDPEIGDELGLHQFGAAADPLAGLSPLDMTLWRRPVPDHPRYDEVSCPECGGMEALSERAGRFLDTRPMPRVFGDSEFPCPAAHPASPRVHATRRRRSLRQLLGGRGER